ncbi:MAG: glycosyltransferase family 4 protein [Chloroflexi bacterium]|nr:glycosyltransferase family 4 protein [Chloroflexota bacterium]
MHYLNRGCFEVHIACNPDSMQEKSSPFAAFSQLPDVYLRPTNFGPSINSRPRTKLNANLFREIIRLPKTAYDLVRYVRKHKIDIIHCSEKPRDVFYGYWLAKTCGAKCLVHLHVKVEDWLSPFSQWAMRRVDALVGVSNFVAESSISMGFSAERTHSILNGLDLANWEEVVSDGRIRAEFHIEPETPLLIAIARLATYKGQADLLRALAKVKEAGQNFHLLIVGSPDTYMSNLAELKDLIESSQLTELVTVTGFRSDVRHFFADSDIFTLPSFEEPFGMVFVEAMAMCKPIVALASGGVPEIVEHGRSGLLSEPHDIEQLAANIVQLIQDQALREQMGIYGRTRVYQYFNAQRMTQDFEKLYTSLVNESSVESTSKPRLSH